MGNKSLAAGAAADRRLVRRRRHHRLHLHRLRRVPRGLRRHSCSSGARASTRCTISSTSLIGAFLIAMTRFSTPSTEGALMGVGLFYIVGVRDRRRRAGQPDDHLDERRRRRRERHPHHHGRHRAHRRAALGRAVRGGARSAAASPRSDPRQTSRAHGTRGSGPRVPVRCSRPPRARSGGDHLVAAALHEPVDDHDQRPVDVELLERHPQIPLTLLNAPSVIFRFACESPSGAALVREPRRRRARRSETGAGGA